jgi:hypothetical protein
VPFGLFRRRTEEASAAPKAGTPEPDRVPFDGLTEEWRLRGLMHGAGRLSDVLNRREPIEISGVEWAPADGSGPFEPAPGLKSVDPYDLIIVLADEHSLPAWTEEERAAHRIHKVPYEVVLEAPPYRVSGRVLLFAGTSPEQLLDRSTEMFLAVVGAVVRRNDEAVSDGVVDAVLLNRSYLRGVSQPGKPGKVSPSASAEGDTGAGPGS